MRSLLLSVLGVLVATLLPSACGTADSASGPGGEGGEGGEGSGGPCTPIVTDTTVRVPEPPDGADLCAPGACNYQTQDACGDGEACRPQYPAGATSVAPGCEPAGDAPPGADCDASSDCVRGALCVIENLGTPDERGVCRKQCCGGDWSACDAGESCIRTLVIEFAGGRREDAVDYCVPVNDCDPFDPDSCDDPNRECKIVDPTGNVACAPRSDRGLGDSCSPPTVCAQGLSCVGGTCVRLCRAEQCAEPGCDPGEGSCVHFSRNPPGVGECTPGR